MFTPRLITLAALVAWTASQPKEPRPETLPKKRLTEWVHKELQWSAIGDEPRMILGRPTTVMDDGRKVMFLDGEKRLGSISKFPGKFKIKFKYEGRGYDYVIQVRRNDDGAVEIASSTALPLESASGISYMLDADMDGEFFEVEEDAVLLYDSMRSLPFTGSIWHLDSAWEDGPTALEPMTEPEEWNGLLCLNHQRQLTGSAPVQISAKRSIAATAHAHYVASIWDDDSESRYVENRSNPLSTEEGAGIAYDCFNHVEIDGFKHVLGKGVTVNLETVYNRRKPLNPSVVEIGLGRADGNGTDGKSPATVATFDMGGVRSQWKDTPVYWPAQGQLDVPTRMITDDSGIGLPTGVDTSNKGHPITLTFPRNSTHTASQIRLYRLRKKAEAVEVEGYSYGPGKELPPDGTAWAWAYENNSFVIHFIASEALAEEQLYEARATWTDATGDHETRWIFQTGQRERALYE